MREFFESNRIQLELETVELARLAPRVAGADNAQFGDGRPISATTSLGALLADVIKPILRGNPATIYCYECRACYATQDNCPVGIAFQAELVVAGRVTDYDRFIRNGGLKCIRCGNCQSFCVQYLPLPQMFGTMQHDTREAMAKGAFDMISKPFRPNDLREVIAKAAGALGFKERTDA